MLYLVAYVLVLLSIFFTNNRSLFLAWGVYFVVLFGLNTYNPDYRAYGNIYRLFRLGIYDGSLADKGFIYLIRQSIRFNLTYQQFLFLFACICIGLLFYFIWHYSDFKNLVPILILIYPLALSIVQLRFFLASLVVLVGVAFLEKKSNKSIFIFLFCLFIGFTIHYSAFMYITLLLARLKSFKSIYLYIFLGLFGLYFLPRFGDLLSISIFSTAFSKYIVASTGFKGIVFALRVIAFRFGVVLFLHFLYYYFKNIFEEKDVYLMKCINIIMFVSMFLELIDSEFERFARIGYIMLFIVLFNIAMKMKLKSNAIGVVSIFFAYFMVYAFFNYFLRSSNGIIFYDSVFKAIFENNYFNF